MEAQKIPCWAVGLMPTTTCTSKTSPSAKSSVLRFVNVLWGVYPFLSSGLLFFALPLRAAIHGWISSTASNTVFGFHICYNCNYTRKMYFLFRLSSPNKQLNNSYYLITTQVNKRKSPRCTGDALKFREFICFSCCLLRSCRFITRIVIVVLAIRQCAA